jgi:hypothetical protein
VTLLNELLSERDYWIVPLRDGSRDAINLAHVTKGVNGEYVEAMCAENERLMVAALSTKRLQTMDKANLTESTNHPLKPK